MEENKELQILQYIKGELDATNKSLIETWMAQSAENKMLVMQIAKIYYANQTHNNILERQELAKHSFRKLNQRINHKRVVKLLQRVSQLAAVLGGILFISYLLLQFEPVRTTFLKPQQITVEAKSGMQSHMVLPDGTKVWLNSGSRLTYFLPFASKERSVQVEGLAYFEVQKDEQRPFMIDVNQTLHIHVLGTKFNVQSYADDIETRIALTEGSIFVTHAADTAIQCHMQEQEEFIFNKQTNTYELKFNPDITDKVAWIHNEFIFKDTPIDEVFSQLSHHFNVDIIIQDPSIQNYKFTGKFKNKRLDHILDYIKATSIVRIQQQELQSANSSQLEPEKIYIYKN